MPHAQPHLANCHTQMRFINLAVNELDNYLYGKITFQITSTADFYKRSFGSFRYQFQTWRKSTKILFMKHYKVITEQQ